MRWVGHPACIVREEKYIINIRCPGEKWQLGKPRHKLAYVIKTYIKETCCKDINWIQRVHNWAYKQTFVNIIITFLLMFAIPKCLTHK